MKKNSLVLYKNQPAVVVDLDGEKFIIKFCSQPATPTGKKAVYGEQKVREKDVVLLHEGPVSSLENVLSFRDGVKNSLKILDKQKLIMVGGLNIIYLLKYDLEIDSYFKNIFEQSWNT